MITALIYTGHLRTWSQCRDNHRQMLWPYSNDMFMHTVEDLKLTDFHILDGVSHRYNQRRRGETSVANTLNQWHNNFIGFALVPKVYDVYVRVRPDIVFDKPVRFNDYDCTGRTIYITKEKDYGGVNDQFAFGNYDVMKDYYSVYLNHAQLFDSGVEFHTETMVLANLNLYGINIVRIDVEENIVR